MMCVLGPCSPSATGGWALGIGRNCRVRCAGSIGDLAVGDHRLPDLVTTCRFRRTPCARAAKIAKRPTVVMRSSGPGHSCPTTARRGTVRSARSIVKANRPHAGSGNHGNRWAHHREVAAARSTGATERRRAPASPGTGSAPSATIACTRAAMSPRGRGLCCVS